jgi:hypothetical protein
MGAFGKSGTISSEVSNAKINLARAGTVRAPINRYGKIKCADTNHWPNILPNELIYLRLTDDQFLHSEVSL